MATDRGEGFRTGFVAIIGAPNAGKSTLLNNYVGVKIAATSKKPQTTRTRILGILTIEAAQVIFLDTPGIHRPKGPLNRAMVEAAVGALDEVDAVLWMIDVARPRPRDEELIRGHLERVKRPIVATLNKIDLIKPPLLLPIIDRLAKEERYKAIVPVSALTGDGLNALAGELIDCLPEGHPLFPEDELTDQPERVLAAEMVREKVFRMTMKEVPYGVAVSVTDFKERTGQEMLYIRAVIHVEKESHKGIIIGAKGAMIKKIGQAARGEIEKLFGLKVFLELQVKVEKDWTKKAAQLRRFGY